MSPPSAAATNNHPTTPLQTPHPDECHVTTQIDPQLHHHPQPHHHATSHLPTTTSSPANGDDNNDNAHIVMLHCTLYYDTRNINNVSYDKASRNSLNPCIMEGLVRVLAGTFNEIIEHILYDTLYVSWLMKSPYGSTQQCQNLGTLDTANVNKPRGQ